MESYVKLDLVENDPGLLRLAVAPHIPPIQTFKERLPTPIVRGSDLHCGSLASLSTTQLAANLVLMERNNTLSNQDFVLPDRIVIQRWDYEDETRSILKLTNPSRDWAPIVVTRPPGRGQQRVSSGRECGMPQPATLRESGHSQARMSDMLDFFDDETSGKPASCPTSHVKTQQSQGTTFPCLQDEFQEEILTELLKTLDDSADANQDLGDSIGIPKWNRDSQGLLDPEQIDSLMQVGPEAANNEFSGLKL